MYIRATLAIVCTVFGFLFPLETEALSIGVSSTTIRVSICGDAIVNDGEDCDPPGSGNYSTSIAGRECNAFCQWAPYCGDSVVQTSFGEECDDGNNVSKDFCSAECLAEEIIIPTGGGGGGGGGAGIFPGGSFIPPSNAQVTVNGKAYPSASVTILKDGVSIGSVTADSDANFLFTASGITPGTATFGFWALDGKGRRSITYTTTFEVIQSAITTVSGVNLPPTLELAPRSLNRGEEIVFRGTTIPGATVVTEINTNPVTKLEAVSDTFGEWELPYNTQPLPNSAYTAKSSFRTVVGNLFSESGYSQALSFFVGVDAQPEAGPSDLNVDGKVNIVDFSIMLFHWGTDGRASSPSADINGDGRVNLTDFSIMIFNWTG